jgi:hypothetical protein
MTITFTRQQAQPSEVIETYSSLKRFTWQTTDTILTSHTDFLNLKNPGAAPQLSFHFPSQTLRPHHYTLAPPHPGVFDLSPFGGRLKVISAVRKRVTCCALVNGCRRRSAEASTRRLLTSASHSYCWITSTYATRRLHQL